MLNIQHPSHRAPEATCRSPPEIEEPALKNSGDGVGKAGPSRMQARFCFVLTNGLLQNVGLSRALVQFPVSQDKTNGL